MHKKTMPLFLGLFSALDEKGVRRSGTLKFYITLRDDSPHWEPIILQGLQGTSGAAFFSCLKKDSSLRSMADALSDRLAALWRHEKRLPVPKDVEEIFVSLNEKQNPSPNEGGEVLFLGGVELKPIRRPLAQSRRRL